MWVSWWMEYLFRSTVESSRTSSRKQKTGYCLPSSLNRSSLILRLIFRQQARIHPISPAVGASPSVAYRIVLQDTHDNMERPKINKSVWKSTEQRRIVMFAQLILTYLHTKQECTDFFMNPIQLLMPVYGG